MGFVIMYWNRKMEFLINVKMMIWKISDAEKKWKLEDRFPTTQ